MVNITPAKHQHVGKCLQAKIGIIFSVLLGHAPLLSCDWLKLVDLEGLIDL